MAPSARFDQHLQSPTRLKLMTMLTAVTEVEFATLRTSLEVTDSVLSKHISLLVGAGYAKSRKGTHRGRRTTWVSITSKGRKALKAHVAALRKIIGDLE